MRELSEEEKRRCRNGKAAHKPSLCATCELGPFFNEVIIWMLLHMSEQNQTSSLQSYWSFIAVK